MNDMMLTSETPFVVHKNRRLENRKLLPPLDGSLMPFFTGYMVRTCLPTRCWQWRPRSVAVVLIWKTHRIECTSPALTRAVCGGESSMMPAASSIASLHGVWRVEILSCRKSRGGFWFPNPRGAGSIVRPGAGPPRRAERVAGKTTFLDPRLCTAENEGSACPEPEMWHRETTLAGTAVRDHCKVDRSLLGL
ncbi:hypothetical protein VTN02DRAFT_43 [Thermoascus thermophilus]